MASSHASSPLVLAAIAGDLARVRQLVAAGSDVNQADRYGWRPLHRAAANDRDRIISFLIQAGSQLEARGNVSWTALHLACVSGSPRAVAALVKAGVDVNAVARNGDTPLHLALVMVIGKEHPSLRRPSLRGARRMLETLLAAGANPLARDGKGRTPADSARERGVPTLATLLERAATGKRRPGKRAAPKR